MKVSCISVMVSSRGSITRIGRQASPSANATGTRRNIIRKNTPNRIERRDPRRQHGAGHACSPEDDPEVVEQLLAEEHQPGDARHRPGHVDEPQRQFGQLGDAVPGELGELDAGRHEHQGAANTPKRPEQPHQSLRRAATDAAKRRPRNACDSRTPIMAPIMMVQMNRKRAISSVQM